MAADKSGHCMLIQGYLQRMSFNAETTVRNLYCLFPHIYIYIHESRFISTIKFCLSLQAKQFNFKSLSKPKSEFNEFKPHLKSAKKNGFN